MRASTPVQRRRAGSRCWPVQGLLVVCCAWLAACSFPGSVPRTVKLGLSAPFEGLYRSLGYEVLDAVRLAVQERNERGGVGDGLLVELVALNDFNEPPEAAGQAAEMAADPGILAVLGGWSPETARQAASEYARLGVTFQAPPFDAGRLGAEAGRAAAVSMGLRRAWVLQDEGEYNAALAAAFAAAFAGEGGEVAALDQRLPGDQEGIFPEAPQGGVDVVFLAADAPTAAAWLAAARPGGATVMGGPQLGSPVVVDIAGPAAEGLIFVSPYPPETPGTAEGGQGATAGDAPAASGPVAAWAYAAASRLLDAMSAAADGPRRQALQATMPADGGSATLYVIRDGDIFNPWSAPAAVP
jgi:branched-chain amino acid transport system substrate-binding protein